MPWSIRIKYTCPICGIEFESTHYKPPERCPDCRRSHHAQRGLLNYRKRKAAGQQVNSKKRDPNYDGNRSGAPESVYASTCSIHLRYAHVACQCCGRVQDTINGYCDVCRSNGANEAQCVNATRIK